MARIRQLLGRPSFWHTPAVDTITERLGKGTYGTVYRGTLASGRGDVAIKQIPIKSEGVLTDAAREFLVQQVVYDCYERSATRECWAPVHHPFPTLYGVTGHLAAGSGYVMRASMFLFQRANHHRRALFEILLQVAAVLCHLNTASGLRFMHRDLHWNNVMRRTNSKQVKLALFRGAKGSCPDTLSHSNSDSGCVLTL
jgi:serine/threonine protein kinase